MKTPSRTRRPGAARAGLAAIAIACVLLQAGCSILRAGGDREPATLYAPDPRVAPEPSWPAVDWQLSVGQTLAARMVDSLRIAVRPTPDQIQVYKGARWAKLPSDMLEDALIRALEDSGRIPAVARQGSGFSADYKLVMDLRRFESDYAGGATPAATIEVNALLLHTGDERVVASRTFLGAVPAAGTDVGSVVDAFSRSLEGVTREMAGWVLASGAAHGAHPPPARAPAPARR